MLNTVQVRNIMRKHGAFANEIYTNKLKDPKFRSVKCYTCHADVNALMKELTSLGAEFKLTEGSTHWRSMGEGMVVKCEVRSMCG